MRTRVSDITSALKALQGRRQACGAVQLYWRYTQDGRRRREPIGLYDPSAPPKKLQPTARGHSIAAALGECRELAAVHAQRALHKLLDIYVARLKAQGRRSHIDARQIFERHAAEAWPRLAEAPAVELTPDQVLDMPRCLIEAGKGRTSNKLRSCLRAACQCALDVRMAASIPMAFKAFAVSVNPVAQTRRSPEFDRADKRPFSTTELRTYWLLIAGRPGREAAALRLHLLTGVSASSNSSGCAAQMSAKWP